MAMSKPTKLPLPTSFAALCAVIGGLIQDVAELVTDKHDVNAAVAFTIPMSGWGTDPSVPSHPNYIDVTVAGLLETDIVDVDVLPGSTTVAQAANFTATQSYAGYFRLRAKTVPTAAISAQYHITNTVAYTVE